MKNLYEALHPKQKRFYNEERKKFIARKQLPKLLRYEKRWQDDANGFDVEHILAMKEFVARGISPPEMLLSALNGRDITIDCLFSAMQNIVDCERIIRR
jgi:hypothetical protein